MKVVILKRNLLKVLQKGDLNDVRANISKNT